jgi:hypothetical protein
MNIGSSEEATRRPNGIAKHMLEGEGTHRRPMVDEGELFRGRNASSDDDCLTMIV